MGSCQVELKFSVQLNDKNKYLQYHKFLKMEMLSEQQLSLNIQLDESVPFILRPLLLLLIWNNPAEREIA